jgi:hypothetical protein
MVTSASLSHQAPFSSGFIVFTFQHVGLLSVMFFYFSILAFCCCFIQRGHIFLDPTEDDQIFHDIFFVMIVSHFQKCAPLDLQDVGPFLLSIGTFSQALCVGYWLLILELTISLWILCLPADRFWGSVIQKGGLTCCLILWYWTGRVDGNLSLVCKAVRFLTVSLSLSLSHLCLVVRTEYMLGKHSPTELHPSPHSLSSCPHSKMMPHTQRCKAWC